LRPDDLFQDHPDVEAELSTLMAEIGALLPATAAMASDHFVTAGLHARFLVHAQHDRFSGGL
jgi:hypothetical protein